MKNWATRIAASLAVSVTLVAGTVNAAPRELSVATYLPAASSFVTNMLVPWADWVNERSGEEFKIKVYAGGTLSRDPNQQDKIVKDGIADMAIIVPGRNPAEYPQFAVFELPGFARSGITGSAAAWSLYKEGTLPDVESLQVLIVWMTDPYIVHSNKAIGSLDDLKGKKFRAIGATQTETVLALGAIPENVKITETAESISRGILDGSLADWPVADIFKITEVTNNHFTVPLGNLPFFVAMNKKTYASLSEDARALLAKSGDQWQINLKSYLTAQDARISKAVVDKGDTIVKVTDADLAKLLEKTAKLRADVASRVGNDLIDAYRAKLKELSAGN